MGLGTGPLKVGMGPEYLKPRLGGIHGNPVSWNNPCEPLPTGTILLKPDQWKNTHLTPILTYQTYRGWGNAWKQLLAENFSFFLLRFMIL